MTDAGSLVEVETIRSRIITLPGRPPAILGCDLAFILGTKTSHITVAYKRNKECFVDADAQVFTLTREEHEEVLRQRLGVFDRRQGHLVNYHPLAFSLTGAIVLSGRLHTPAACRGSVSLVRALSKMIGEPLPPQSSIDVISPAESGAVFWAGVMAWISAVIRGFTRVGAGRRPSDAA